MSTTTSGHEGTADTEHAEHVEHAEHDHPSDWAYVKIALILGAITAVEVLTYFDLGFSWGSFLIPSLLLMMVVKFWLVATWFMHLKFDNPIFAKLFVGGLTAGCRCVCRGTRGIRVLGVI